MKSVVKHQYIRAGWGGNEHGQAHIRYIAHRPGACERGFFNATSEAVSRREVYRRLEEQGPTGVSIHKVMLSPGTNDCDMREYTREVMKSLSSKTGLDLVWYAVVHRNTAHWHVHVVVMGKDRNGRAVRIEKTNYPTMRETGDRFLWRTRASDPIRDRAETKEASSTVEREFAGFNRTFANPSETINRPITFQPENKDYTVVQRSRRHRNSPVKFGDEFKVSHRGGPHAKRKAASIASKIISRGLRGHRQSSLFLLRRMVAEQRKTLARTLRQPAARRREKD